MKLEELRQRFSNPGIKFDDFAGGLTRVCIKTSVANGELFLHGAHCAGWQPAGCEEVLWMSQLSHYHASKPIRGGVPICFPWFGPHSSDKDKPAHGAARLREWDLVSIGPDEQGALCVQCTTQIAPFELRYAVSFGKKLTLSLTTSLPAEHGKVEQFEDALHTYLAISNIQQVEITGLENVSYIDKMDGAKTKPPTGSAIKFTSETDRVYIDTPDACTLHDPAWSRRLVINKSGSRSTIVWNPWIDKSVRMSDFGDDEWTGMVCIETGNVGADAVQLSPGQQHTTQAEIEVL